MLTILVDENVPYALESFGRLGSVRVLPGRGITAADLKDVDVLIVRSVTRVDEALLSGSPVKFVGTATIGCDHVDVGYLDARGIQFASAPGSNANSVAEYIVAALLVSARERQTSLDGATMTVVGVGNVGSRVVEKAHALGLRCLLNDPPRQREEKDEKGARPPFVSLDEALPQSDYVTLHVPLERHGPDATVGLAGRQFFGRMRSGAVLLNTSRGDVVDEAALAVALDSAHVSQAILDVWQGEPEIDPRTMRRAFLATPHIAGYSFDGKVAATEMLFKALCAWLGGAWAGLGMQEPPYQLPPPPVPRIDLTDVTKSDLLDEDLLRAAVSAVYDIEEDDRAMRTALAPSMMLAAAAGQGREFDLLRKTYKRRREFPNTAVMLRKERDGVNRKMARLGFRIETQ